MSEGIGEGGAVHALDPRERRVPRERVVGGSRARGRAHEVSRQRQHREDENHGHGIPDAQVSAADRPGEHGSEQGADVVELVEAGDHRVDAGPLGDLVDGAGGAAGLARDPRGRREGQRCDDRDAEADDEEAEDADLPRRAGREDDGRQPDEREDAPARTTARAPRRAVSPSPKRRASRVAAR